jgi:hypothetical protein
VVLKRPRGGQRVIENDADKYHATMSLAPRERREIGGFLDARYAPRGPKVHDHNLTAMLGEIERSSVEFDPLQLGGHFAEQRTWRNGCAHRMTCDEQRRKRHGDRYRDE